jgi:uncharacterized membrane protein
MANDDSRRLSELTIGEAKRVVVYGIALALAVGFVPVLIGQVLMALLLGLVAGAFLLPVQEWLERRLQRACGKRAHTIALSLSRSSHSPVTPGTSCRATRRQ